jgi:tRNA pseudouridine55 synthase
LASKETYYSKHKNKLGEQFPNSFKDNFSIDTASQQEYIEGKVILIDKPLHWTSFDVVRKLRSLLSIKKIGHAGTLDPLATGLLIVCTGKFTKKINEYMAREKEYTGHFTLGAVTPTYDLESEPEQLKDTSLVTEELLYATAKKFIGEIDQLPPMYSAIKKDGVPLYKLARKGEEVELKPRKVVITNFMITQINLPIIEFKVTCSTGTYIRSLANDLGAALGCGAYLSSLCRTRIGEFTLNEAMIINDLVESLKANFDQNG